MTRNILFTFHYISSGTPHTPLLVAATGKRRVPCAFLSILKGFYIKARVIGDRGAENEFHVSRNHRARKKDELEGH
ncbi:hypothetical protein V1477_016477 [Vespula maculifrons]|uniref:Uncharacterized protein n=1 Tax=Vespula maculifrons TaxID=7453 RepID=A0ABD2B970_VESMC